MTIKSASTMTVALITLLAFIVGGCSTAAKNSQHNTGLQSLDVNELKMTMLSDIATTIINDNELNSTIKADIARLAITPLQKSPEIQITGTDRITRPIAVNFQKAFEQSLVNMIKESQIAQATAIIHTRQPTTPLCNLPGEPLVTSLHPTMQDDPLRKQTIQDRTITLRRMAKTKQLNLYVAYVQDGLSKRSPQEQSIYHNEVNDSENISLHDAEMNCPEMPDEIVGASYILTTHRGNSLYFGNNGTQAIDGKGNTHWRYWFGSPKISPVDTRYHEVIKYLKECGLNINL